MLTRLEREDKLKSVMDCGNNKEQTPLYLAVYQNLHGIVKILVDKGADPNCLAVIRHSNGEVKESKSAIHVASVNKKDRDYKRTLIELLKSKKLKINSSNNFGQTALHCAIQAQYVDPEHVNSEPTLKLLLDAEADIHYKDKDGLTPLMYAVKLKQLKLVKFLIEYCGGKGGKAEAIVKDTDHHKRTAQDMASEIRDTIGTEIWNILYNACT
ncbi:ankyrin repeat domain-containing protein 7-like isoform X4 [Dreissena polymorpha]|nr:ankyrin repeat domain-containing protein 7-like isoform X4 [Dreissena polymorpha]